MDSTDLEIHAVERLAKAHSSLLDYPELEALQRQSQHHRSADDDDMDPLNLRKFATSDCNRCRKTFAQMGSKPYKMCSHCRFLQRQRSKRWQQKTKSKDGVCRRCGTAHGPESKFVLCLHCRDILRRTKASRVREGKCVHCSGPNLEGGSYKVCKRCRDRDKLRRVQLEDLGNCNRCAEKMPMDDTHKLCVSCRAKKSKESIAHSSSNTSNGNNLQLLDQLEDSTTLFGESILEAGDHAQLNRQLSQISQMSQFDIENLMRYDTDEEDTPPAEEDSAESEMVAAVAAAINMSSQQQHHHHHM